MKRREFIKSLSVAAFLPVPVAEVFASEKFKRPRKWESAYFDVVRVSESVFAVRGKENSGIPTNTAIIIGERGVAVVDTHLRPSLDREVIELVGQITAQPIRYLVNTHWHQDHTLGNQAYEGRVQIVGHASTKSDMLSRVIPNLQLQRETLPEQLSQAVEALKARSVSRQVPERELKQLALEIELDELYMRELEDIHVVPPTEIMRDSYRLDISDQPIEVRHFGFGHTHGDVVVYLPQEKTIILGDLMTSGQPFMRRGDAVPSQWGTTLQKVQKLPWEQAVVGHGWVENPRDRMDMLTHYFGDLVDRVRQAVMAGIDPTETAKAVRLDEYAPYFPYFSLSVLSNIERTYEELSSATKIPQ